MRVPDTLERQYLRAEAAEELIKRIQAALGTEETGDGLVEVAAAAHQAELELAGMGQKAEESHLVIGQCPECYGINQHYMGCERRKK